MTARILVVDDDADTRAMLRDFFETEGYLPETADSGEEALLIVGISTPDLILLDAVMPGLDGFETCRQIKNQEGTAHIPIIFMTGLSDPEHVVGGLDAGGVDYVTKPVALDVLAARVRVHLGNARAARNAVTALDSAGARLLVCDKAGKISWTTPEAQRLLDRLDLSEVEDVRALLSRLITGSANEEANFNCDGLRYVVRCLGATSSREHLFKITPSIADIEPQVLQKAFGLTPREADVLLWTSRGKSNKDMSEILNISARTVNKHLEQIFIKIGVENRASAAIAATRVLILSSK